MNPLFPKPFCSCAFHASATPKLTLLGRVLGLVGTFAGFEFVVGQMSHSLSLQADSGHMLSDGLALAIALFAAWMARRSTVAQPSTPIAVQFEVWAALVNGVGLVGMAGLIGWEAYSHWQSPPTEILSVPMLITAILGLVINGISLRWLQTFHQDDLLDNTKEPDLNVQGAFLHVLADVMGSVGVILAAIAVWMWGWTWADDVISLGLAVLIGGSAVPLIQKSVQQLRGANGALQPGPIASSRLTRLTPTIADPHSELQGLGFYEIGQTNLNQMIVGGSSAGTAPLGAQPTRPQNTDNQPQSNKTSRNKEANTDPIKLNSRLVGGNDRGSHN